MTPRRPHRQPARPGGHARPVRTLPKPPSRSRVGAASPSPAHLAAGAMRPLGALGPMAARGPGAQDFAPSARGAPTRPRRRAPPSPGGRARSRPNPFNLLSPRAFRELILETGFPESPAPPGGHSRETGAEERMMNPGWVWARGTPAALGQGAPFSNKLEKSGAWLRAIRQPECELCFTTGPGRQSPSLWPRWGPGSDVS